MAERPKYQPLVSLRVGTTDARAVESYYDELADSYDTKQAMWQYRAPEDAAALLAPLLRPGARVLDVGCGTGLLAETLRRRVEVAIDGIDISSASLQKAQGRGYGRLMQHDLQRQPLPAEDGAYDAAVSIGVLTYIADAEALLRDMGRVVRRGGVVVFSQRTDLWHERAFDRLLDRLEADGLWRLHHVSAPMPYLPGHAEFAEDIKVIYAACRIG